MSQFNDFGGGGGGFLAGGSPYGASQGGSPGGSGRKAASHSLRPVTIKQAVNASQTHADAELYIDDDEVGQLTVVAQVISIQTQTTNSVYWLDDGTGRIEARHWMDSSSDEDADKWAGITENIYVRVTGVLKNFGNKRYINATHIRPTTDAHEVFFHLMEAMVVTLAHTRGNPPKSGEENANGAIPNGGSTASAYTSPAIGSASNDQFAHLPPLQKKIIDFILQQPPNDEGVHVAAIARAVQADAHKISEALDKLMDEGHVFSTIDESHFNVSS